MKARQGTRKLFRKTPRARLGAVGAALALGIALLVPSPARASGQLTIAAAADLDSALRVLIARFERQTGADVRLVLGSSGNLTVQIEHGAPYDLFFSADVAHAVKLERENLIVPGSLELYAVGRLVVYVPSDSSLDFTKRGLAALIDPSVRKIAIANPRFAPYGQAAVAALRHANLYAELEPRLVLGEDVSQTTGFVVSGNAQAALTALSLMFAPATRAAGRYWLVPQSDYPPIEQAVAIVGRSREKSLARKFLNFIETKEGRAIFRRYGFATPEKQP